MRETKASLVVCRVNVATKAPEDPPETNVFRVNSTISPTSPAALSAPRVPAVKRRPPSVSLSVGNARCSLGVIVSVPAAILTTKREVALDKGQSTIESALKTPFVPKGRMVLSSIRARWKTEPIPCKSTANYVARAARHV